MALENNLQLKIELLNPLIEETRVMEALANFDSVFYVNSMLETKQNLLIAPSAIDPFTGSPTRGESRNDSFIFASGLRKPLPTGGTFVTQFSAQRYRFNQPGPSVQFVFPGFWRYVQSPVINPSVTSDLTFSLRQPLLRNFGTKVNQASIEIARIDQKAARYAYQARCATIIGDVNQAYWELVYQRRLLEVRRRSFEYARDLHQATARAVRLGALAGIEAIRTKEAAASREADLVLSRAAVGNAEDRLRGLLRRSRADIPDEQTIIPVDEPAVEYEPTDEKRALYTALTCRSDFLAAKERAKANDVRLVVAKNQLLPLLDLSVSFTINGLGGNLSSSLWSHGHDPLEEVGIFNSSYQDFSATINFELPIGNRQAQSLYTRTRLTKLSQLYQVTKMEEDIVEQVLAALRNLKAYAERVTSTTETRELAEQRLEAEQAGQEAGTSRVLDVLDAEDRLAQAQAKVLRARVDYRLSLVALAESQGILVEQSLNGSRTFQ